MARQWVTEDLWNIILELLPPQQPKPKGGRPRVPDRDCLLGIIFVLRTGCAWNQIPLELGAGSGPTCWRRFKEWTEAGLWPRLWQEVLNRLGREGGVDLKRAVIDSAAVRAVFGGCTLARTPQIAGKMAASATS
jgi:transposase